MKINIEIGGLRCDHCVAVIDTALRAINGVTGCDVTLTCAIVDHNEATASRESLFHAIRGAGAYEITGFNVSD